MWRPFNLPSCTTRGRRSSNVQLASACARVPVYYLTSPVAVVGVEDRPPFSDLGCALRHRPAPVLRSQPGVAPWLPHEGHANGEGGRGHDLLPPGAVLRQACPLGELRREVEVVQVALKRPALGHRLAAGDAGLFDPGGHEAHGEVVLGHARHLPCPEQRSIREVVLEREDPGALLWALGADAVCECLARGNAVRLVDPLVVPVAQPPHRLCGEAPRLAAAKESCQRAARVRLSP